jgi:putative nucleotidyltransferase with HDIG domain
MLNDGKTEPVALETHLEIDQVLVAKLLAIVNSPFYCLQRQIKSVREAITVVGFRGLRSLLLASSVARFMNRDFRVYGHDTHGMPKHSFGVGSAARALGKLVGLPAEQSEELFVAGLLHDIGKLLLVGYLEQGSPRTAWLGTDVCEHERKLIGIDHSACGALVAAKWNLSQTVQEILKLHHAPGRLATAPRLLAIVRVADARAHERGLGFLPEVEQRPAYLPDDLDCLGLKGRRLEDAKAALDEAFVGAMQSMEAVTG